MLRRDPLEKYQTTFVYVIIFKLNKSSPMEGLMKFTFEQYKNILQTLLKYLKPATFDNYYTKNYLYIRHDIDIFSENIVNMATVESALDIRATYFFQPNCEFYNMLSPFNLHIIEKIHNMGHVIGIHVDTIDIKDRDQLLSYINDMYSFFSNYLPIDRIISFHRPPDFIIEGFSIDDFINIYDKKYFKDIRYFSDSKRREFEEELLKSLEKDHNTSVQLLTHPYWWDHIDLNLWESWRRYMEIKERTLESVLKREIKPYKIFFDYRRGKVDL